MREKDGRREYASRSAWEKSPERHAMLEKLRTFKPHDKVEVHGAYGVVDSVEERSLSVRVRFGGRGKPLPYQVSVVNKVAE